MTLLKMVYRFIQNSGEKLICYLNYSCLQCLPLLCDIDEFLD